jgi:hypothetical protein
MGCHDEVRRDFPTLRSAVLITPLNDLAADVVKLLERLLVDPPLRLRRCILSAAVVNLDVRARLLRFGASHAAELLTLPEIIGARISSQDLFERGSHQDCFGLLRHEVVVGTREFDERKSRAKTLNRLRVSGIGRAARNFSSKRRDFTN